MAGTVFLGAMAAFGLLSLIWTVAGWILPREEGCILLDLGIRSDSVLYRYRWLRRMGFLSCPLWILVPEGAAHRDADGETEEWSREELFSRLEQECNQLHGTGNGDSSGRHQRRGISEL